MLNSFFRPLVPVALPYQGRQHYMHGFDLSAPVMLEGFEDYREPVMALCEAAGATTGTAYMTVDEKIVPAGMSQRKPGPHVDGCFMPHMNRWGGGGWNHFCNNVPFARMPVIVASDVAACRAWEGMFDAVPTEDGDLSHLDLDEGVLVPANVGYLLSPDCVHESLRMSEPTRRTFLRIALPTDYRMPA